MTTTASIPSTVNQNLESSLTLTCQRCQHFWIRRNLNKLPKTCPRCGSPAWQKAPSPYLAAKRKETEKARQQEAQNLETATKRIQQLQEGQLNPADLLILYSCPRTVDLEPIKDQCNFWLPEKMSPQPSAAQLYRIGNTIASTGPMLIQVIRDMIAKEQLPYDRVFYITIEGKIQTIMTYTKEGITQTFKQFDWPNNNN